MARQIHEAAICPVCGCLNSRAVARVCKPIVLVCSGCGHEWPFVVSPPEFTEAEAALCELWAWVDQEHVPMDLAERIRRVLTAAYG